MRISYGIRLLTLVCCFGLAGGCASTKKSAWPAWMTFGKKAEEPGPKIMTPRDKIMQLRELTERSPKMSPELQERVSNELALAIPHEQDPVLRAQILRTLSAVPTEKALLITVAGLSDQERDVRIAACDSLGKRGGPQAAQALAKALAEDSDVDVRLAAARGLGLTNSPEAITALGDALEDQDPAMQYRAIASLKKVSGKDFGNDIGAWRQYAKSGQEPDQPSLVQRLLTLRWF